MFIKLQLLSANRAFSFPVYVAFMIATLASAENVNIILSVCQDRELPDSTIGMHAAACCGTSELALLYLNLQTMT